MPMFGFLNPRPHSAEFRRCYARVCQHQRQEYGALALAFHSYEAVFLYQCAVAAGAVDVRRLPNVRCCRLRSRGWEPNDQDSAVGRFCSAVALLLAGIKLEDDIRDNGSLTARLLRGLLRPSLRRAQ